MIRPYMPCDKPHLVALFQLNSPQYFAESEEEDYKKYLDRYSDNYFVVEEKGQIIGGGGINYFPEDQLARISWDLLHPDHQGKGIGTKLTQFRIREIKKDSAITTIVVRTSQVAYRFYEKQGFELEKTIKDFWAEGFDLYQMKIKMGT